MKQYWLLDEGETIIKGDKMLLNGKLVVIEDNDTIDLDSPVQEHELVMRKITDTEVEYRGMMEERLSHARIVLGTMLKILEGE